jgi:hypothetical protein
MRSYFFMYVEIAGLSVFRVLIQNGSLVQAFRNGVPPKYLFFKIKLFQQTCELRSITFRNK